MKKVARLGLVRLALLLFAFGFGMDVCIENRNGWVERLDVITGIMV